MSAALEAEIRDEAQKRYGGWSTADLSAALVKYSTRLFHGQQEVGWAAFQLAMICLEIGRRREAGIWEKPSDPGEIPRRSPGVPLPTP